MTLSKSTSVLLVGNDHYSVLAAVRALRAAGYAPWLTVYEPNIHAARSRAVAGTVSVSDPSLEGERFVRELSAVAQRLSVAAVLPSVEIHLRTLANREADFSGIVLGVPSRGSVERATDKGQLPELAARAGLRTPPTRRVTCGDIKAVSSFGFPAIVKPARSRTRYPDGTVSGSSTYVSQASEALKALPSGEGLVQPYIPGPLVSV